MLTEVNTSFPSKMNGDVTAFMRRSAASFASAGSLRSSRRTVNSSPPRRATMKPSPRRATVSVARKHSAQHPAESCVFVEHAVLTLELGRQSPLMGRNFFFHAISVRIMDAAKPFFRLVPNFIFPVTQHVLPAGREIDDTGLHIPVPQAIVGAPGRQRISLFTLPQCLLRTLV